MAAEVARPNPALHMTAAASGGVRVPAPGADAAGELGVRLPNCPMCLYPFDTQFLPPIPNRRGLPFLPGAGTGDSVGVIRT